MLVQAILPVRYDRLTEVLRDLVEPYFMKNGHPVAIGTATQGEVDAAIDVLNSGRTCIFAGHGSASHLHLDEQDFRIGIEDVAHGWSLFSYACWSALKFGEHVRRLGGEFIGYQHKIPFAFDRKGDGLDEAFLEPIKIILMNGVTKAGKNALEAWYRSEVQRLIDEKEPDSQTILLSLALEIHLEALA